MCKLTEDAALAQRTGVLQQQPGVDTVSVILVKTRQHPQTLRRHFIDASFIEITKLAKKQSVFDYLLSSFTVTPFLLN